MTGQNMIGKFDKKRKEQKALLKELESIKSLLDDGELIDDDYSDLADTAIKKTMVEPTPNNKPTYLDGEALIHDEANFDELILDEDEDFLISNELDIDLSTQGQPADKEIPILEEIYDNSVAPTLPPGVLPGQQSLFNENKKINEDKKFKESKPEHTKTTATNTELDNNTNEALKQTNRQSNGYQPLEKTDNPFLPPHIRERLGGTIDIPAYAQSNEILRNPYIAPKFTASEPLPNTGKTLSKDHSADYSSSPKTHQAPSSTNPFIQQTGDVNQKEIIDALVNEFMPKIESKLRLRLAKILMDSQKNK